MGKDPRQEVRELIMLLPPWSVASIRSPTLPVLLSWLTLAQANLNLWWSLMPQAQLKAAPSAPGPLHMLSIFVSSALYRCNPSSGVKPHSEHHCSREVFLEVVYTSPAPASCQARLRYLFFPLITCTSYLLRPPICDCFSVCGSFMVLILLRNTGQLFCRKSLYLDLPDVLAWSDWAMDLGEEY